MSSSSRLLLLFMNLKYHGAREAINSLIEVPNAAAAHRDALRRGQVRAELHRSIKTLIGSITRLIEPIRMLIGLSISTLIARITTLIVWITPLIAWISVLIGTAIKKLIASITALIVWISVLIGTAIKKLIGLIGLAISMVIGVVQEGNGPGIVVGDPAVGCELVEDARDLAGASEASPARKCAHARREGFALCQAFSDGVEHQRNRRGRDELVGSQLGRVGCVRISVVHWSPLSLKF